MFSWSHCSGRLSRLFIRLPFHRCLFLLLLIFDEVWAIHLQEVHEDVVFFLKLVQIEIHNYCVSRFIIIIIFLLLNGFVITNVFGILFVIFWSFSIWQRRLDFALLLVSWLSLFIILHKEFGVFSLVITIKNVGCYFLFTMVIFFVAEIHSDFLVELLLLLEMLHPFFEVVSIQFLIGSFWLVIIFVIWVFFNHLVIFVEIEMNLSLSWKRNRVSSWHNLLS